MVKVVREAFRLFERVRFGPMAGVSMVTSREATTYHRNVPWIDNHLLLLPVNDADSVLGTSREKDGPGMHSSHFCNDFEAAATLSCILLPVRR